MIAVIFVRVAGRHNGGETGHRTTVRRDGHFTVGEQSMMTKKKSLRLNLCNVNRKKRAKPAGGK